MKKALRKILLLLAALSMVAAIAAPAGAAGSEVDNWLEINSPGSICLYNYASVNAAAVSTPPGSVTIWSQAAVVWRVPNPCNFALTSAQSLAAGTLQVQGFLVCKWTDHGGNVITQTVWTSPLKSNDAGTGIVEVHNGSATNPCHPTDFIAGSIQERTIVHGFVCPVFGCAEYDRTTNWVTR